MSVFENEYRVTRVPTHQAPYEGKKWVVSANGSYVKGYHRKKPAVKEGRKIAKRNTPASLVVEYEGGGIANKIEYK